MQGNKTYVYMSEEWQDLSVSALNRLENSLETSAGVGNGEVFKATELHVL